MHYAITSHIFFNICMPFALVAPGTYLMAVRFLGMVQSAKIQGPSLDSDIDKITSLRDKRV